MAQGVAGPVLGNDDTSFAMVGNPGTCSGVAAGMVEIKVYYRYKWYDVSMPMYHALCPAE